MNPPATIDESAWRAWRPGELALRLREISRPWCVVGGWALDLWHGGQTREHEDLEFTILRGDFATFRHALEDMRLHTVHAGVIEPLPERQAPPATVSQIWCEDVRERCWRVDMMIEPGTPDLWICKRNPTISRPRAEIIGFSREGVPYLKPAAVLLFKAKYVRDKDEADFARALPRLEASERAWLKDCLAILHPGHGWVERL
ncbi:MULTISPECIES: amino acid transporter [unclassified Mesorhizobium]|uniref:nucleotidyltransferase domain-containing protein n=1 Tax=unclassified Mesorhizobium TaxID=325217 RepID=UPI00086E5939|nr:MULTISPECIES: amino acid transporter [unclassified Mesorhizobium]MBN9253484.1 amino acid transporter [Mesorhizobium sp.]MBN9272928.1 amino acid transporter [Mesorhizobium sp.]ODT16792.1 MAG: amino acid transporter [Mesorhizobium sp. SCN 65-12]OJX82082.1 MAG: amino acid transporter [Mesorhizobium sp. 65-26]